MIQVDSNSGDAPAPCYSTLPKRTVQVQARTKTGPWVTLSTHTGVQGYVDTKVKVAYKFAKLRMFVVASTEQPSAHTTINYAEAASKLYKVIKKPKKEAR